MVVPVKIEGGGHFLGNRTESHDIKIGKIVFRIQAKIFVADISATDDGKAVVGHDQFVVHAMVELLDSAHVFQHEQQCRGRSLFHRIKESNLNIGMLTERSHRAVGANDINIIYQNANPHTAVGGLNDTIQKQVPAGIGFPDKILHIQCFFSHIGQQKPPVHGIIIAEQFKKSRMLLLHIRYQITGHNRQTTIRRGVIGV